MRCDCPGAWGWKEPNGKRPPGRRESASDCGGKTELKIIGRDKAICRHAGLTAAGDGGCAGAAAPRGRCQRSEEGKGG